MRPDYSAIFQAIRLRSITYYSTESERENSYANSEGCPQIWRTLTIDIWMNVSTSKRNVVHIIIFQRKVQGVAKRKFADKSSCLILIFLLCIIFIRLWLSFRCIIEIMRIKYLYSYSTIYFGPKIQMTPGDTQSGRSISFLF